MYNCESMEIIFKAMLFGFEVKKPIVLDNSA